MKHFWAGVKDLFKRRIIVLGTIFGILLLSWYMTVPIEIKDCSVGNYQYGHKFFNMCSDKIIYIHPLHYTILNNINIAHNADDYKRYTRYNIAGHIENMREVYNSSTEYLFSGNLPDFGWLITLTTIGHYDEAKDYLKYFPSKSDNFDAINSIQKEYDCYINKYFVKSRRINILTCKLLNPITTWYSLNNRGKADGDKKNMELAYKFIENAQNDIIEAPESDWPRTKLIRQIYKSIEDGQLSLAEKYINEYASIKTPYNGVKIKIILKLGIAYMNKQNYKKAIEYFNKILEIQDYNYKAHEKLEICYRKLGNTKKANEHAQIMKELLAL